jgi:hypothetical protein
MKQNLIDRFIKKISPEPMSGCWLWTGGIESNGYGGFYIKGITRTAHRASYYIYNGSIEKYMYVCHKCDNKLCVNPKHLFIGNSKDNAVDCSNKKRFHKQQKTHCPKGHEYSCENLIIYFRKLTGKPHRRCRICTNANAKIAWHKYYYKNKEKT